MKLKNTLFLSLFMLISASVKSQSHDDLGAWYMMMWQHDFKKNAFGIQGDFQFRNWNMLGDLEQLLIRQGVTYRVKNTDLKLTAGYAFIQTGTIGEATTTTKEDRIYQEVLLPQKVGNRALVTHRFRYEQRFLPDQDLRTRYRYFLSVNVPLNQTDLSKGAVYTAFYNEIFINGQNNTGEGQTVALFDRNRVYGGIGYSLQDRSRVQFAIMQQSTNAWKKSQLQMSWHQTF